MEIDDLIKEVSPQEQVELKVLHNAVIKTMRAYKDDSVSSRLKDWQVAKVALADEVARLTMVVNGDDGQSSDKDGPHWKKYNDSKSKADVLRFLQSDGWEVKKQTFYNHCNSGKLSKNRNGLYTRRLVKKYAEKWLVRRGTGMTVAQEVEDLATKKTMEEIKRISTSQEHERFKLDTLKGKYIFRSDVEVEFAARAVVLDNGLEYLFQANLAEMIALVGGDQQRAPQLLEFLLEKKNQQMNEYANMGEFMVVLDFDRQG